MKRSILLLCFLIFVALLTMCEKEDDSETRSADINSLIESAGNYDDAYTPLEEITPGTTPIDSAIDFEPWVCTTTHYNIIDGNEQQPLFDANSNVIYPGNLLQGGSLDKSPPDVIVVERAGGTISYNLNNGNLTSSFSVDQVSKSSIQDAMNNIINGAGDVMPANFVFTYSEVQSREQFALELGLDVNTKFVDVEASMGFSTDKSYSRILVKLTQQYYTMSFDLPTSYDKLFAPSVTVADLEKYIGPGNPATYISDVTYGRIFYMLFESTSSSTNLELAVSASFSGFGSSVSGDLDLTKYSDISDLNVKVIAFGGDAEGSMSMVGLTDLGEIAERMANSTDIKAGLPISYNIRNVYNNQTVKVKLATEFDVVNCVPYTFDDEVADIDGNIYKTVVIGTQTWMAENLRTTRHNDGSLIPYAVENATWDGLRAHGYCYYNNDPDLAETYGYLYNQYAVQKPNLAPEGWHVPSGAEYSTLIDFLGGTGFAGGKMKEEGTEHWLSPNTDADNTLGFTALPGGYRNYNGAFGVINKYGYFWTTSENDRIQLDYNAASVGWKFDSYKRQGFSVRCIKD